ncbi:hypothetical protein [Comamonas sp.]|uniref:hypothetical protein n=2 Tax=Comamonas sp. TaxID=34028 RepID=UPI002FCB0D8A
MAVDTHAPMVGGVLRTVHANGSQNSFAGCYRLCSNDKNNQFNSKVKINKTESTREILMNAYYQLAALYYNRFHGSHLFPSLWNWRWLLCLCTFSITVQFIYWYLVSATPPFQGPWGMFIAELLFIGACLFILHYRSNQVLGIEKSAPFFSIARRSLLDKQKRQFLTSHTQRPASDYAQLAQEITDLLQLQKAYRSPIDADFVGVLNKLYHPQALSRAIAIVISALGIFFALIDKNSLRELQDVFQDQQTLTLITELCKLAGGLFILAIITYLLTKQLIEIFMLMAASFISKKMGNRTMLNCLVRDLIDLHTPHPTVPRKSCMPYSPTGKVWIAHRQNKKHKNI